MTNEIDWTKAPEGATHYIEDLDGGSLSEFVAFEKGKVGSAYYSFTDDGHWSDEVDEDEDFKLTAKPLQPVFTKAMQDKGELPSVGMKCMVFNGELMNAEYEKATVDFIGCHIVVYSSESCTERTCNLELVKFKPVTPPIELIDGNWYLVKKNYGSEEERVLHRNHGLWFYDISKFPDDANDDWTVISKLTAEGKS